MFRVAFQDYTEVWMIVLDYFIEVLFLIDMGHNFILTYNDEEYKPVRSHSLIAKRYILRGSFFFDLAAIIPL
jgi:hypothetical protein